MQRFASEPAHVCYQEVTRTEETNDRLQKERLRMQSSLSLHKSQRRGKDMGSAGKRRIYHIRFYLPLARREMPSRTPENIRL